MATTEIARVDEAPQAVTLFGSDDPEEFLSRAGRTADALSKMLKAKALTMKISGRDYVRVEGWTALGSMLGVFPVTEWTRRVEHEGDTGWEARVTAVTRQGDVIGAAEASCMRSEKNWSSRDDYALRSMAQTRATGKALRQPLGFVVSMAGYEATPAEEMPRDDVIEQKPAPRRRAPASKPVPAPRATDVSVPRKAGEADATAEQRDRIYQLVTRLDVAGMESQYTQASLKQIYAVSSIEKLGTDQAADAIRRMEARMVQLEAEQLKRQDEIPF